MTVKKRTCKRCGQPAYQLQDYCSAYCETLDTKVIAPPPMVVDKWTQALLDFNFSITKMLGGVRK
jgi:hypothetical protein